jgi:phage terminase large subunit
VPDLEVDIRGEAQKLWTCRDPEVLIEGPAGTGKSFAVAHYLLHCARRWPGCRILVVRKTRKSLTDSFMVTLEQVMADDPELGWGKPASPLGNDRLTRHSYRIGQSEIVLGGMDEPTRLFSTSYDIVFVNEATELTLHEWETLHRALRHWRMPYQQLLGDCNPSHKNHWLRQRTMQPYQVPRELAGKVPPAREGQMMTTSLHSRHEDNPTIKPAYLARLAALTGPRKERLYWGRWVTTEGLIYPEWDESKHIVSLVSEEPDGRPRDRSGKLVLNWFFGAQDWGYENPGCAQVWGVDRDDCIYRVAEIYWPRQTIEWWSEVWAKWVDQYDIRTIVCDHDPEAIRMLNDRLGIWGGRRHSRIARRCIKARPKFTGWNHVRDQLAAGRLFFVRDAHPRGFCPELLEIMQPACSEQEIDGYVYRSWDAGHALEAREDEAPGAPNHGMDTMLYAAMWHWKKDVAETGGEHRFQPGSYGAILGHEDVMRN